MTDADAGSALGSTTGSTTGSTPGLTPGERVLFVHAHPDDETTAAGLRARGFEVLLAPMLRFEPAVFHDDADAHYGAVIVTTPQPAASNIARKGGLMFQKVNVPILGVAENMSYFVDPAGADAVLGYNATANNGTGYNGGGDDNFVSFEGLHDVAIGAGLFDRGRLVVLIGLRRADQHLDGLKIRVRAEMAAHLEAVHARHQQVEHDEIGVQSPRHLQALLPVARGGYIVLGAEKHDHQLPHVVVVVHDQHALHARSVPFKAGPVND